jgi:hypothetical protein
MWLVIDLMAVGNVALVIATWPHPPKLAQAATLVICGGAVLRAYRKDPASFRRPLGRKDIPQLLPGFAVIAAIVMLPIALRFWL